MRYDKEKAILFRKEGRSYDDIAKELNVSKGTLWVWFKGIELSAESQELLGLKRKNARSKNLYVFQQKRSIALRNLYKEAEAEATLEFGVFKNNPLFIAGICIYWGEGDKASKNSFRISNSDPEMIRLFISFLLNICKVDKKRIRLGLIIYPDLNEVIIKEEWMKRVGLTADFFTKSAVIQGKHKTKKAGLGICTVNYSSTYLKKKMLVWIKILSSDSAHNAGIV